MKPRRKLTRRSFLATIGGTAVAGSALFAVHGEAGAAQATDNDPTDPVGRGRGGTRGGITDRDPTDPIGRGQGSSGGSVRSGLTDSDPTDPSGNGRTGNRGCSDRDPTDPGGNGRNCGTRGGTTGGTTGSGDGGAPYQTGRYERRYEVCWVDHPGRSDEECNLQTYSEWQTTWSDGRVEYDTSESSRRRDEMTARGYTARSHRMVVNDWVGQP